VKIRAVVLQKGNGNSVSAYDSRKVKGSKGGAYHLQFTAALGIYLCRPACLHRDAEGKKYKEGENDG
jgi:hypothetical protein